MFGRLAALYPHLVTVKIDDFTHDVAPPDGMFTAELLASVVSNLHQHSDTVNFMPTAYYSEDSRPAFERWPDLALIGDSLHFAFRSQKQGAGPCEPASCVWGCPPRAGVERGGGCLAGVCAEPTVANLPGELADFRGWLPPGKPLLLGICEWPEQLCIQQPTSQCATRLQH